MPFTSDWFQELAAVDATLLDKVDPGRYRPTIEEVANQTGHLSTGFRDASVELVREIHKRGYRLGTSFRVHPGHAYTYEPGRSFQEQLNIGFIAGTDAPRMRIGVGYRTQSSDTADLMSFYQTVREHADAFDDLVLSFRSPYLEPGQLDASSPSTSILAFVEEARTLPDWLFWGSALYLDRDDDRAILASTDTLADHVADIFGRISASRFGR